METSTTLDQTETKILQAEWTDEKHSLYLKGMEATFVDQLYGSTDHLIGRKSSKQVHCNASTLFGQLKVFRGGCWKKACYGRADFQLNKEDDSHYHPQANPWNQHFRHGCERVAVADPALQETAESLDCRSQSRELPTSSEQLQCRVQDLVGSENEVSDQNFVGEDVEGEKARSICVPKRMKRPMIDYSNNYQPDADSSCS